ncbi:YwpF family protein [Salirhabdus sp. Marseille-P4669]|uniref:YwpF family protein n=1 Tax=Salirhabdus sp. Marseille-P4669 TaxID=2042310 RepID=UPI000C7E6E95|nr:YwpF family protein [Salirhabdus sp. Marseille-P4669]
MKTFKLVSLSVLEKVEDVLTTKDIELIDGLIINREDEQNQWLIEAYTHNRYKDFFDTLKKEKREKVLQVKITKPTNTPATFMVKVKNVNKIGGNINVLFLGTIINRKREKVEEMLQELIEEGYQGAELLEQFKKYNKI